MGGVVRFLFLLSESFSVTQRSHERLLASHYSQRRFVFMLQRCCQQTPFVCKSASVSHGLPISCDLRIEINSLLLSDYCINVEYGVIVLCTKQIFIYRKNKESCFSRSDLRETINKYNCGRGAVRLHDCKLDGWVGRTAASGLLKAPIFCWAGNILLRGRTIPLCYMELYFAQR